MEKLVRRRLRWLIREWKLDLGESVESDRFFRRERIKIHHVYMRMVDADEKKRELKSLDNVW